MFAKYNYFLSAMYLVNKVVCHTLFWCTLLPLNARIHRHYQHDLQSGLNRKPIAIAVHLLHNTTVSLRIVDLPTLCRISNLCDCFRVQIKQPNSLSQDPFKDAFVYVLISLVYNHSSIVADFSCFQCTVRHDMNCIT